MRTLRGDRNNLGNKETESRSHSKATQSVILKTQKGIGGGSKQACLFRGSAQLAPAGPVETEIASFQAHISRNE